MQGRNREINKGFLGIFCVSRDAVAPAAGLLKTVGLSKRAIIAASMKPQHYSHAQQTEMGAEPATIREGS